MVQRATGALQVSSASSAGPVSDGQQTESLRTITAQRPPLRLDFIKQALVHSGLDNNLASFIIRCIRDSTQNQYERVWKTFCSYCRRFNVTCINDNTILGFFNFLLNVKQLKVATLISYRSALIDPLNFGFNYNVNNILLNKLLKGMANSFPSVPTRAPDWNLNKVLKYISDNSKSNNIYFNAQKVLFLTSIALGNRISELFALRRGNNFLKKLPNGSLRIYSDPLFLAKNENPLKRRGPVIISPFDNSISDKSLCPVRAIEKYLRLTRHSNHNQLFVHPKFLNKWNISGMRLAIIRLIRKSQPQSFPRCLDLRQFALSLAFYNEMEMDDLLNAVGWKTSFVFIKHYLQNIEKLRYKISSINKLI